MKRDIEALKEQLAVGHWTAREEEELAALLKQEPGLRQDWLQEQRLQATLRSLPDLQLSSNFTALVMQKVALDNTRSTKRSRRWLQMPIWLPRWAVPLVVAALGVVSYSQYHAVHQRHLADSAAFISQQIGVIPRVEWLSDFDAIGKLSSTEVDEELLAGLKEINSSADDTKR